MDNPSRGGPKSLGFTVIEMLIAIGVISIVGGIAFTMHSRVSEAAGKVKIESDVAAINSAIKAYRANGGDMSGLTDPEQILLHLKARRNSEATQEFVGLSGRAIDPRIAIREVGSNSDRPRAVWDPASQRFEVAYEGRGFEFFVDDTFAEVDFGSEERKDSIMKWNREDGWIWSYRDQERTLQGGPTVVPVSVVGPSPGPGPISMPVPLKQLAPPIFNPQGSSLPATDFPIVVSVSNPNPVATSLMVSVNGSVFAAYSGPIHAPQNSVITAFVEGDPATWLPSEKVSAAYAALPVKAEKLLPPVIKFTNAMGSPVDGFSTGVSSIQVELVNPNPSGSSGIMYRVEPVSGGKGTSQKFASFGGPFSITNSAYPEGFGVRAFAIALTATYEDSVEVARFATAEEGLFGGHLDLDTSDFLSAFGLGSSSAHTHDITGAYNLRRIDMLSIPDSKQIDLDEAVADGKRFKLIVVNGNLSPGLRIVIESNGVGGAKRMAQSVSEYDDAPIGELAVYSLGNLSGARRLTGLAIEMNQDALLGAGVIPTRTGEVRANVKGKGGEWRNGALTIQAVEVGSDGSDRFSLNPSVSSGGSGGAASGLLWEAALFWHWSGASYNDKENKYQPGKVATVKQYLDP